MNRSRFLITGARAPSALQLARILGRSGHEIVLADSVQCAASYQSKWVRSHVVLPSPALEFEAFVRAAKRAVAELKPETILCTCEEIFYWAKAAQLDPAGFAPYFRANPRFEILRILHHKGVFARIAGPIAAESGVKVPVTRSFGELGPGPWVCKPAFSRFAVRTRLGLSAEEAHRQIQQRGWIAQQQVIGREFCTWAFFVEGREVCAAAYEPIYRAGRGSGIGLKAIEAQRAAAFARNLAEKARYTGQLAFDWIENDAGCHVLECNPRLTSGIHFFDQNSEAAAAAISCALEKLPFQAVSGMREDVAIKWAMLMFGSLRMLRPRAGAAERRFFRQARDVEHDHADPAPSRGSTLLQAFREIVVRAIKARSGLLSASTSDIEWNGNHFWKAS